MTNEVVWTPKLGALRVLVLLALHRAGGKIDDPSGRVSSRLRERCGLPDSRQMGTDLSQTCKLLESAGLVERDRTNPYNGQENPTRTYGMKLRAPLDDQQIRDLESMEMMSKGAFSDSPTMAAESDRIDALHADCKRALDLIRDAARSAERVTSSGAVAINLRGVLSAHNLRGPRAAEIRHYLRLLDLTKSCGRVSGEQYLYWWRINLDDELDRDKLHELATGEDRWVEKPKRADLDGWGKNGPVTVRKVSSETGQVETEQIQPVGSDDEDDPAERILQYLESLEAENAELRTQVKEQGEKYQARLDALQTENEELRRKLNAPSLERLRGIADSLPRRT